MGPEATVAFYARLVERTPAARDQDHLRVIVDGNPKVPDRTAAIVGNGESPVPAMRAGIDALARAGADFVVIPCVSAHAFLDDLRRGASLPLVSIFDAVADDVRADPRGIDQIGLLATTGTVRAGFFERRLREAGIGVLLPDDDEQARVLAAIFSIKAGATAADRHERRRDLRAIAGRLVARGARGIVLGCTEVPLVFGPADAPVPVFDSLVCLAGATIRAAGRVPLPPRPFEGN
jgi:aspartate racemase